MIYVSFVGLLHFYIDFVVTKTIVDFGVYGVLPETITLANA